MLTCRGETSITENKIKQCYTQTYSETSTQGTPLVSRPFRLYVNNNVCLFSYHQDVRPQIWIPSESDWQKVFDILNDDQNRGGSMPQPNVPHQLAVVLQFDYTQWVSITDPDTKTPNEAIFSANCGILIQAVHALGKEVIVPITKKIDNNFLMFFY